MIFQHPHDSLFYMIRPSSDPCRHEAHMCTDLNPAWAAEQESSPFTIVPTWMAPALQHHGPIPAPIPSHGHRQSDLVAATGKAAHRPSDPSLCLRLGKVLLKRCFQVLRREGEGCRTN